MNDKIRVGTVGFPGRDKKKLLQAVDVVELIDARFEPPSKAVAKRGVKDWPAHVHTTAQVSTYLVEAPRGKASLPGEMSAYGGFQKTDENLALWDRCIDFAEASGALALVVVTPPSFTPGPANVARFTEFFAAVPRKELVIAWEPHGPWDSDHAVRLAAKAGLVLAVDPLRDPPPAGEMGYFRLGAFASMGSRLGLYDLERLAEAASAFESVICVFDTPRAVDDVRNLKAVLEGYEPPEKDEDEDEFDEDDGDDEDDIDDVGEDDEGFDDEDDEGDDDDEDEEDAPTSSKRR